MAKAEILWRRLDTPGHDACRLEATDDGRLLDGMCVYLHEGQPASLSYRVASGHDWRTVEGAVHGWVGELAVEFEIERTPDGLWILNGESVRNLEGCVDLDLGFTPATNLFQLRRKALAVGQTAEFVVAWLDVPAGRLQALRQRYERKSDATYWYEAPLFNYSALLEVNEDGFVTNYPGLWAAEP